MSFPAWAALFRCRPAADPAVPHGTGRGAYARRGPYRYLPVLSPYADGPFLTKP